MVHELNSELQNSTHPRFSALHPPGSRTNTQGGKAMEKVYLDLFLNSGSGSRLNDEKVKKILLYVTDGAAQDSWRLAQVSDAMKMGSPPLK